MMEIIVINIAQIQPKFDNLIPDGCCKHRADPYPGSKLLRNIHVKTHVNLQEHSNLASHWLADQQPANEKPG